MPVSAADLCTPELLYLDLLKKCLSRGIFAETYREADPPAGSLRRLLYRPIQKLLDSRRMRLVRCMPTESATSGRHWPLEAETMIGQARLDNLQACVTDVIERGVSGDLIETGVWRGGATIFMRAVLKAYGDPSRTVWVADSFRGLPKPDEGRYPADRGDRLWAHPQLAVPLEQVRRNFERYGLLDDRVRFLEGWFRDTLPTAPIERLAILRLDGDLYESTMDALRPLYPKLSPGGYVIVDDYGVMPSCRAAVEDYRREHGIGEEIRPIDWSGVFWQKQR